MKFLRCVLFLVFSLLVLSCNSSEKKSSAPSFERKISTPSFGRDLSTPLSRLVGRWKLEDTHYYFGPFNTDTKTGPYIYSTPRGWGAPGLDIKSGYYKLVEQNPSDKFIKIHVRIGTDEDDFMFSIEKNGSKIHFVQPDGTIAENLEILYVDSKTSPPPGEVKEAEKPSEIILK